MSEPIQSFSDLTLSPALLRAIQEMGYDTPSPIQAEALPVLLAEPTDFLGLAGTGTGKTATFAIPLLERLDPSIKAVQALILCPTRELAVQVAGQVDLLGKYKGLRSVTIYGGASYTEQIRGLHRGAQIVVGTPGRIVDHLEKGTLKLDKLEVLVLDEADEMFSMGFKDELDAILEAAPSDTANTWLFSATMSTEVRRVVDRNLKNPKTVQVNRKEMLSSGVEQLYYRVQEFEKPQVICALIEGAEDFYGVIFCQTKSLVADLTTFLVEKGYRADSLHGDKDQTSRERTMQAFRDRKLQVLVCTDVAARGLDVKDITHVINYSLPRELDSYVHRIGRTARSGKTGYAMNLLTFSHRHLLTRIEAHTKVRMKEGFVPTRREIGAKKVAKLMPRLMEESYGDRVLEVMGEEFKAQLATMTVEDVASKFIAMLMPDIFAGEAGRKTKRAERSNERPVDRSSDRPSIRSERPSTSRPTMSAPSAPMPASTLDSAPSMGVVRSPVAAKAPSVPAPPTFEASSFIAEVEESDSATPEFSKPASSRPRTSGGPSGFVRGDAPPRKRAPIGGAGRSIRAQALDARKSGGPRSPAVPAPPTSRPSVASAPAGRMNLAKAPRHEAGLGVRSRHAARTTGAGAESTELNRRARRAAKFGHASF